MWNLYPWGALNSSAILETILRILNVHVLNLSFRELKQTRGEKSAYFCWFSGSLFSSQAQVCNSDI